MRRVQHVLGQQFPIAVAELGPDELDGLFRQVSGPEDRAAEPGTAEIFGLWAEAFCLALPISDVISGPVDVFLLRP